MSTLHSNQIAIRKLKELNRETVTAVVDLIPQFIEETRKQAASQKTQDIDWYQAMQDVAVWNSPFPGIGGPPKTPFTVFLFDGSNAKGFFETNISDDWKIKTAKRVGDKNVYREWVKLVSNGGYIAADMMEGMGKSLAKNNHSWWGPDPCMNMNSSNSPGQGNDDFFAINNLVSLAPEWYPNGLVMLTIALDPAKQEVVRPDTYDGLTSPLWVQRPASHEAKTGGEARETLTRNSMNLEDLVKTSDGTPLVRAYIVSTDLTEALKQSPSVVDYSVDLSMVSSNALLGPQERLIAETVRESRAKADAQFPKVPMRRDIQALIDEIEKQEPTMSPATKKDLKEEMVYAAKSRRVKHRGQRFPYEQFQDRIEQSSEEEQSIMSAATELISKSDDPEVLSMIANLGRDSEYKPFYQALLHRLEGGIPEGPGIRTGDLKSDLLLRLREKIVASDSGLASRAFRLLDREKRYDLQLAMLHHQNSEEQMEEVLKSALRHNQDRLTTHLLELTGAAFAKSSPEKIDELKQAVAGCSQKLKTAFVAAIE